MGRLGGEIPEPIELYLEKLKKKEIRYCVNVMGKSIKFPPLVCNHY